MASSADEIKVATNLRKIGLPMESWDAVVTGEAVRRKKPAPDIFLIAAERLGVSPAASVIIEDAINGIQAAKAAGMRCIAVAHTFPVNRLHEADVVSEKISDILLSDIIPGMDDG